MADRYGRRMLWLIGVITLCRAAGCDGRFMNGGTNTFTSTSNHKAYHNDAGAFRQKQVKHHTRHDNMISCQDTDIINDPSFSATACGMA
jgi:hypothetical protein